MGEVLHVIMGGQREKRKNEKNDSWLNLLLLLCVDPCEGVRMTMLQWFY